MKRSARLAVVGLLVAGCAGEHAAVRSSPHVARPVKAPRELVVGRRPLLVGVRTLSLAREQDAAPEPGLVGGRLPLARSADGRALVAAGHALVLVSGRSRRVVARDSDGRSASLLAAGGIAYVTRAHRLVVVHGTRRRTTAVRLPAERAPGTVAVSPDGRHALFASRCSVWIADSRTGLTRRFAGRERVATDAGGTQILYPDAQSWSPDGRFVALERQRSRCDGADAPLVASGVLATATGRLVASLPGCAFAWRPDGLILLVTSCNGMGSSVGYIQDTHAVDPARRHEALILRSPRGFPVFRRDGSLVAQVYTNGAAVAAGRTNAGATVRTLTARLSRG